MEDPALQEEKGTPCHSGCPDQVCLPARHSAQLLSMMVTWHHKEDFGARLPFRTPAPITVAN